MCLFVFCYNLQPVFYTGFSRQRDEISVDFGTGETVS